MPHHQNEGYVNNESLKNKYNIIKKCEKLKYLGMAVTKINCIHGKTKSRLNSENDCSHSVQEVLSSHLLSTNVQTKTQ
jgi:hypothetical protein